MSPRCLFATIDLRPRPHHSKDILDTLNQLKRDEGLALVVVTHAERVARYTCEEEIAVPFEG